MDLYYVHVQFDQIVEIVVEADECRLWSTETSVGTGAISHSRDPIHSYTGKNTLTRTRGGKGKNGADREGKGKKRERGGGKGRVSTLFLGRSLPALSISTTQLLYRGPQGFSLSPINEPVDWITIMFKYKQANGAIKRCQHAAWGHYLPHYMLPIHVCAGTATYCR